MIRANLAPAALVAIALFGSTGCGGRPYRARYYYAYPGSVSVVSVAPVAYEPPPPPAPPPPPPPAPAPRIMRVQSPRLPPGTTVIIVNPTPAQVAAARGVPVAPVAPASQVEPQEEPQIAPQQAPRPAPQQGWFEGE